MIAFADLAADALVNLTVQPQRTALALLGVMIGTACVIAMLSIGHMAELQAVKIFASSGVDMLVIEAGQADPNTGSPAPLPLRAMLDAPHRNSDILAISAATVGTAPIRAGAQTQRSDVVAAGPELQLLAGLRVARGRNLELIDRDSQVALVGSALAGKLSAPGAEIGPGTSLQVGAYLFRVVGVLTPRGASTFDPADFDNGVIVPSGSATRVFASPEVNAGVARLRPGADADAAAAWAMSALQPPGAAPIRVQNARELLAAMKAQKAVQARLLAAIGAVSLFVGGIGVMNVMVMSVIERRREIGLRAAIGASPEDIRRMFLVESVVLTLAGGVAGVLAGVGVAFLVAQLSGWEFSLALGALPLGLGVAGFVGLAFGLYPAIKAARLTPIEALRAD